MQPPAAATFPKSARLRKRAEFTSLAAATNKHIVKGFLVVWNCNGLDGARLGVTVSRKIGCAVVRNRLKRLVRERFRHCRVGLPAVDINVIARRESVVMDSARIFSELDKAFGHIRACSNP